LGHDAQEIISSSFKLSTSRVPAAWISSMLTRNNFSFSCAEQKRGAFLMEQGGGERASQKN